MSRIDKLKGKMQDGSLKRGNHTASSDAHSTGGTRKGMTLSTSAKERLDSLKQDLSSGALRDPSRDARVTWKDVARVPSPVKNYDVGIGIKGWNAYKAQRAQLQTDDEEKNWAEKLIGYLGTSSPDATLPMANITQVTENYRRDNSYQEPNDSWNSEERRIFGYLWASDQKAALKYASDVNDAIAQGKRQEKAAVVRQDAADGFWKGLGHSAAAVGGGALGLADYLNAVAEYSARGKISQQEDLTPFAYSQEVTGGVSEHLNEKYGTLNEAVPVIGGKGLGDVYGLGMSIAQSGAAGYTGGQLGTLVQFFGSAAASGTQEAKQRGADDQSALMYGTMAGIAEGLAEEIGVDNLFKIGSSATMRELILNLAKQGAAEGLEEGITSVLNNFSDQLVMGDKSNFHILVQDYMRSGWEEEEAKKQAWIDMAEDVAYDMLGGFVSGAVHAAPVTGYQTVSENRAYSSTYGGSAAELVQEGLESEEGSLSKTLAEKYQQKLDQGGTLTGAEIHRLVNVNEQQILKEDANAIRQAAADRLTELGENGNVMGIADVLTKRVTKQKLTAGEKKMFLESKFGQRVANELDPTNIESGNTASGWTRNINTSRVMADVFGQQEETDSQKETEVSVPAAILDNLPKATQNNAAPTATAEESQAVGTGYRVVEDGNAAKIASISSTDGKGGMQVKLEDGSVVDAAEVGYASEGEAVLYEAVAKLGADAEISNILINTYRKDPGGVSAEEYAAGMLEAFSYGRYNIPRQQMTDNRDVMALTEMQRNGAYELGRVFGKDLVQTRQANAQRAKVIAKTKQAKQKAGEKSLGRKPKVHFERQGRKLSDVQETALTQMEQLSVLLGTEFQVYESYTNEDGARVYMDENGEEKTAPNGWYEPGTGVIHVDLNAGAGGEGTMAFTVAHELTHFIRQWSPEKFDLLAETVFSTVYAEKDISVMDLIREQQRKAERSGRKLSLEEAYEEAVADAMEGILTSGNVVQMMAEVKQRDVSLWEKIREWFRNLAEDIKKLVKAYEKYKPDSKEGRALASTKEMLPIIEGYYADALLDASENYQATEGQKNTTPVDGNMVQYSIRKNVMDVDGNAYDDVIELEYRVFNKIRRSSKAYINFLRSNLINKKITVYDDNGDPEIIEFAKDNERVRKDGTSSFRRVLGELERAQGDVKKLIIINAEEVTEISEIRNHSEENSHQWLDQNGWDERWSYVMTQDGTIFPVILHIAKTRDGRNLLYSVNVDITKGIGIDIGATFAPTNRQVQQAVKVPTPSDRIVTQGKSEVKKKMSARDSNEDIDSAYMEAVNSGDMKTAQKMVDEAAKQWGAYLNNSEANEVFHQSGEVRIFFHGTNTGDFTVFDKSLLGNSSGDLGWFGKGFYFAFSADEANVYGSRVIHAYLKMKNPYDYSQLYKFKGSDHGSSRYARFAWLYNIAKQFPDIATDQRIYAYPNDAEDGKAVSWNQLAGWMDRIEKDAKFSVVQVELSDGDTAWELRADPKQESFTNEDGETFTWTEYGMRQLFATEMDAKEPINQIGAYLVNVMGVKPVPRRAIESIDFSGAVQRAGYDGILQSPSGDEAVVFDSSQIKLSDPVTYDDGGNIIPISKRFDNSNSDIRYSARDPLQEKTISALEKQNAKLSEDVQQLQALVKLQGTLTGGKLLKASSVEAAARMLKKRADSKGNTKELAGLLTDFYDYILKGEELTWEGVKEAAEPAAAWLLENRKRYRDAYAQEILTDLKGRSISLNESQKAEAASYQGSYGGYRKMLFGSVKLTKDGLPLDDAWQELSSLYPGVFDKDMNANDMPEALAVIIDRLNNTREDAYAYSEDEFLASMIREVYDSYWNVTTLYTVADKKQKQIDLLKGQHYEQMQQLKQEHRNSMENIRDSRNKADYRRKIRKVIRDLDKLLNRGDKKQNVKEGMQDFASSALTAFETLFTDHYSEEDMVRNGVGTDMTPNEERWMREAKEALEQLENLPGGYEGYLQRQELEPKLKSKLHYRMNKLKDVFVRERARLNRTQVSEVLGKLADSYRALEASEDVYIQQAYHENVYQYLLMLKEDVGGTTVRDMTLGQLEELYKGFTMVMTTVRKANRMFAENLKETRDVLAQRVIREVRTAGGKGKLRTEAGEKANTFSWNNEKPVYAFERIGSDTFTTLFNNIRKGQDGWAVDLQEADAFRRGLYTKYNHSKWDFEKERSFTSSSGLKFTLNLEQIMSLYAYSKREQAYDHLMKGGFVFDGKTEMVVSKNGFKRTYLKKDATAYNLSPELLEEIISLLTPEQKAFADEMQAYLSDTMGEKGNEVSMQLYGIRLFKEKFYFPLRSAGQYMERAKEADLKKEQGQINIVNSGFAKATKINASNPVVLSGFMQTWAEHVNEMSMYHSFVLPMEDFRRVYNFSSPHVEEQGSVSVNSVLQNAYGEACVKYIDQLYRDLNGGALVDNTTGIINKLMNLFKKGAVFASASVTIQQGSAIARAAALVDVKHFIGPKVDRKRHKALWDEVKQYAPVAFIKEMGYFDTNMGRSAVDLLTAEEYRGFAENALAMIKDEDHRDEFLSKGPALADELTWCVIWDAVKRETKARNPKLDPRSEEFLKLAGERFSEVIDKTQVYDSVLSRSANMRSKDTGMKMATAFMAEPTTSINMIEDALRKGKRGDRRYCRRAIGAVLASVLLNSALVSLVYAARDDDEEKTFAEKYVGALTGSLVDGINPATYIPFIKDIMSIVQGYDVERSDMAVISDAWNALQKLTNDDVSLYSKVEAIGGSLAQLFGLPVKNIMRDLRSVYQAFDTFKNGEKATGAGFLYAMHEAVTGKAVPNAQQLYEAKVAADAAHTARVTARYDDADSANAAVRGVIRERFLEGEIDTKEALRQLVLYSGMDGSEAHWTMDAWEYRKETGSDEGYSKFNGFHEAVRSGEDLEAVVESYINNGVTASTLSKAITEEFKPVYMDMSQAERDAFREKLIDAYEICGMERDSAAMKLKTFEWQSEGIDTDSFSVIQVWEDNCKPVGIDKRTYYDAYLFYRDSGQEGVSYSKAIECMPYIGSLPLTAEQKTALALCWWGQSTVKKYKTW